MDRMFRISGGVLWRGEGGFQTRPYGVMPNNGRWWVRDEL